MPKFQLPKLKFLSPQKILENTKTIESGPLTDEVLAQCETAFQLARIADLLERFIQVQTMPQIITGGKPKIELEIGKPPVEATDELDKT